MPNRQPKALKFQVATAAKKLCCGGSSLLDTDTTKTRLGNSTKLNLSQAALTKAAATYDEPVETEKSTFQAAVNRKDLVDHYQANPPERKQWVQTNTWEDDDREYTLVMGEQETYDQRINSCRDRS
tara:strand:+ start:481 stop:858 length:378 start_codon:yes stop_codon:yes gene_type:complete